MMRRIVSLVLILAFSFSNLGLAQDFRHLAPPLLLDDISDNTPHNKNIVLLSEIYLQMHMRKMLGLREKIENSTDISDIKSAFGIFKASGERSVDEHTNPSRIKIFFNQAEHIGGTIFRVPASVKMAGKEYFYSLLFSTKLKDGIFPVVWCEDESQLKEIRDAVASSGKLPEWNAERKKEEPARLTDAEAQAVYRAHQIYDKEVISWAHDHADKIFVNPADYRIEYGALVKEIAEKSGIVLSTADMSSLLNREFHVGVITPALKKRLETYRLTVPLTDGTTTKVMGYCHSSNTAIHIFLTKNELESLRGDGQTWGGATNILKLNIAHEIGVMLGCQVEMIVGAPGNRRPFNSIDKRYADALNEEKVEPEQFKVMDLDTNLKTRDAATGEAAESVAVRDYREDEAAASVKRIHDNLILFLQKSAPNIASSVTIKLRSSEREFEDGFRVVNAEPGEFAVLINPNMLDRPSFFGVFFSFLTRSGFINIEACEEFWQLRDQLWLDGKLEFTVRDVPWIQKTDITVGDLYDPKTRLLVGLGKVRGSASYEGFHRNAYENTALPEVRDIFQQAGVRMIPIPVEMVTDRDKEEMKRILPAILRDRRITRIALTQPVKVVAVDTGLFQKWDPDTLQTGAVNTAAIEEAPDDTRYFVGRSTDGEGTVARIKEARSKLDKRLTGFRIGLIGFGGFGRAFFGKLIMDKEVPEEIIISESDKANSDGTVPYEVAVKALERIKQQYRATRHEDMRIKVSIFKTSELDQMRGEDHPFAHVDVLMDATPVGMNTEETSLSYLDFIQKDMVVLHAAYRTAAGETRVPPILSEAYKRGALVYNGLGDWVGHQWLQAVEDLKRASGLRPDMPEWRNPKWDVLGAKIRDAAIKWAGSAKGLKDAMEALPVSGTGGGSGANMAKPKSRGVAQKKQLAVLIEKAALAGLSEVKVSFRDGDTVYYMDAAKRALVTFNMDNLGSAEVDDVNLMAHLTHYSRNPETKWLYQSTSKEVRELVARKVPITCAVPECIAVLKEEGRLPVISAKGADLAEAASDVLASHKVVLTEEGVIITRGANESEALFGMKITRSLAELCGAENALGRVIPLTPEEIEPLRAVEKPRQALLRGEAGAQTVPTVKLSMGKHKYYAGQISRLRKELYVTGREMARRRLVDGPGGNISACTRDRELMVIKASGFAFETMNPEEYVVVDMKTGNVVEGFGRVLKPSVEAEFHRAIYLNREDVSSVVHGHPIYSSAIATVSEPGPIEIKGINAEALHYMNAGRPELARGVGEAIIHNDTLILAKHGAITVADTLEEALQMTIDLEDAAAGIVLNKIAFDRCLEAYNAAAAKLSRLESGEKKNVKDILAARNEVNFLREELWMESEVTRVMSLADIKDGYVLCELTTKHVFRYNKSYEYWMAARRPGNFVMLKPLSLTKIERNNRDVFVKILRESKNKATRRSALKALVAMVARGVLPRPLETNDVFQHCHSTYSHSPGNTPQYIAWKGYLLGLLVTGIVDHDTIAGFGEFREAASVAGLRNPTCGYEQRCVAKGTPFEFMETNSPGNIGETYIAFHAVARARHKIQEEKVIPAKIERFKKTAAYLNELDIITAKLDYDKHIKPLTEAGNPTEKHVAEALARLIYENFAADIARGEWAGVIAVTDAFIAACCKTAGETKDMSIKERDLDTVKGLTQFTFLIRNRVVTILKRVSELKPAEEEVMADTALYRNAHHNKELIYYCYLGGENPCAAENRKILTGDKRQAFLDRNRDKGKLDEGLVSWWLGLENATTLHLWLKYQKLIGADGVAFMPNRNTPEEIREVIKIARECGFTHIANGMDVNTPTMPFTYFNYSNEPDFVEESLAIVKHENDIRTAMPSGAPGRVAVAILEVIVRSDAIKSAIKANDGYFTADDIYEGWGEVFRGVKEPGIRTVRDAIAELEAMHIVRKELQQDGRIYRNHYYPDRNDLDAVLAEFKERQGAAPAQALPGRSIKERVEDFLTAFALSGPLQHRTRTGGFLTAQFIAHYDVCRATNTGMLPALPTNSSAVTHIFAEMVDRDLMVADTADKGGQKYNLSPVGIEAVRERIARITGPAQGQKTVPVAQKAVSAAPPAPLAKVAAVRLSADQKIEILAALSTADISSENLIARRAALSAIRDRELNPAQIVKKYAAIGRIDLRTGTKPNTDILHRIARGRYGPDVRIDVHAALAELYPIEIYRQRACEVLQEMLKIELNTSQKIRVHLALAKFGPQADRDKHISTLRNVTKREIGSESDRIDCYLALAELNAGTAGRDPVSMLRNRLDKLDRKRASGKGLAPDEITQEIRMRAYLVKGSAVEERAAPVERAAHIDRLKEMMGIAPSSRISTYVMEGTVLVGALVRATGISQKEWLAEFEKEKIAGKKISLGKVLRTILRVGGERIIGSRLLMGGTVSDPAQLQILFIDRNFSSCETVIFNRAGETNNWKLETAPAEWGFGWREGLSEISGLSQALTDDYIGIEYPVPAIASHADVESGKLPEPPVFGVSELPQGRNDGGTNMTKTARPAPAADNGSSARQGGPAERADADRDMARGLSAEYAFEGVDPVEEEILTYRFEYIQSAIEMLSEEIVKRYGEQAIATNQILVIPGGEIDYTLVVTVNPENRTRQIGVYKNFVEGVDWLFGLVGSGNDWSAAQRRAIINSIIMGSALHEMGHGFDGYSDLDLYSLLDDPNAKQKYLEYAELLGMDAIPTDKDERRRFAEAIADMYMAGPGGGNYVQNKAAYLFYRFVIPHGPEAFLGNTDKLRTMVRQYFDKNPFLNMMQGPGTMEAIAETVVTNFNLFFGNGSPWQVTWAIQSGVPTGQTAPDAAQMEAIRALVKAATSASSGKKGRAEASRALAKLGQPARTAVEEALEQAGRGSEEGRRLLNILRGIGKEQALRPDGPSARQGGEEGARQGGAHMAKVSAKETAAQVFNQNPAPLKIKCQVMPYPWGDTRYISDLVGSENHEDIPQAELWIGAHPKAPAEADLGGVKLDLNDLISASAGPMLGEYATAKFGPRLPYLLKVLAAATSLSVQAHPNKKQAEEGWQREKGNGPNYTDDNHKPESVCAITRFWALNGFRPIADMIRAFEELDIPELKDDLQRFKEAIRRADGNAELSRMALKDFYSAIMGRITEKDEGSITTIVAQAVEKSKARISQALGITIGDSFTDILSAVERADKVMDLRRELWAISLNEQYPNDIGALSPYLLNLVRLEPGEAMNLPAGELHAYLGKLDAETQDEGACIELMANSDNVLRGGLTSKRVDVPELLNILTFNSAEPEILTPQPKTAAERVYATPASEFELSVLEVDGETSFVSDSIHSADAIIVLEGAVEVSDSNGNKLELMSGDTAIVPAAGGKYVVRSKDEKAKLYKAGLPINTDGKGIPAAKQLSLAVEATLPQALRNAGIDHSRVGEILKGAGYGVKTHFDMKTGFIFSPATTFGFIDEQNQYTPGLLKVLEELAGAGIKVAVVTSDGRQAALVEKLNEGKIKDRRIKHTDDPSAAPGLLKGATRFCYFKVKGEDPLDIGNIENITIAAQQIIAAIGRVFLFDSGEFQEVNKAMRPFAVSA